MLMRNCAGGVVFNDDKVFLLKNDKGEWVLPKGVIRNGNLATEVALRRVKEEAGIDAEIISTAGETCYEFFSISRQCPVCNQITWYIMHALDDKYHVNKEEGFTDGGYFPVDEAIRKITYSQDKSLVGLSYKKYKDLLLAVS
ncbi:NUDIX hydrolase [Mahella sp.]|uniref:NUDIX hydrolase n=1 Tax=Mahella sp. TaxID=2798721 RepID=UPI0025BD0799|nr:NUDIX hydrolase [Mahella sp.]MBZ4665701.1 hydrolase [Mahella sp.]